MDDYKFEQRRKKRGDNCIFAAVDQRTGVEYSVLCGCGCRTPPHKKYQKRIVRRALERKLRQHINLDLDEAYATP